MEQSEIQSCETPVRVSLTTILEIVGQVLVPACPIEVGAKMSHAPSVVQGSTPRDHNLHRVEYSLMAVRDDTYFLITRQYPCSQDFEEPPPIFIVLRFNQSKRQRNQPVIGIICYCNQDSAFILSSQESPIHGDDHPTMLEGSHTLLKSPKSSSEVSDISPVANHCFSPQRLHHMNHARVRVGHCQQQPRNSVV